MFHIAPVAVITVSPFRDEAVDVRVPFKIPAKGVKDHDETGSEILRHIHLEEHSGNYTGDSMKEAIKEFPVFKKEVTEVFIDGENAVPMSNIDQFEGHVGGAFHRIFVSTGGAETAVTAEWNEFQFSAFRTSVHGTAIRRITTMDHLLDVFNHSVARMKSMYHFFIMI